MNVEQIRLNNFRVFESFELNDFSDVNLLCGPNGSGKTSLLEAIHVVSSGKSFRNAGFRHLINHHQDAFQIFLKASSADGHPMSIGIHRDRKGGKKLKFNQNNCDKQSDITRHFPVVSVDTETYHLVDRGPQSKRSFLDWMVFHVKHVYLHLWSKANACHKQLNACYKKGRPSAELEMWEEKFAYFAEKITQDREAGFSLLQEKLNALMAVFFQDRLDISLKLEKGWRQDVSMMDQLQHDRKRNMEYGIVQSGPHKMNISIRSEGQTAAQVLSRGQKKILSVLFYLSHAEIVYEQTDVCPVLCLDDIGAELDMDNRNRLFSYLSERPNQLFLTAVSEDSVSNDVFDAKVFHVEHQKLRRNEMPSD